MKKKQCQRIKKASKLLVSALMLGVIGCLSTTSANSKELWEAIADLTTPDYRIRTNPYVVTQDLGVLKNKHFTIYGNGNVIDGNSKSGIIVYPSSFWGSLYIDNVTMSNFYSDSEASGAIYNEGTIKGIVNSSFVNNRRDDKGGAAIYNEGRIKEIVNSSFMNNSSLDRGGAIHNLRGTIEKIVNSNFESNHGYYGGAIYNLEGTIEIIDSSFINNNGEYGGAIHNVEDGHINITAENKDVVFENNTATRDGGAIYNYDSTITLKAAEGKTIEFKSGSDGIYNDYSGGRHSCYLYIGDDNYKGNVILNGISGDGITFIKGNAITNGDIQQKDLSIFYGGTLTILNGATISGKIYNYDTINIANGTINADITGGGSTNILKDGIASITNGKNLTTLYFKDNATLNLQNNNFDTVTIAQFGAGETGNLSFDIGNDNNDKIDISDWANGTLNLKNININVDGGELKKTLHLFTGEGDISALKINDYIKPADGEYYYRLTQDPTNKGDLVLKHTAHPWTLKQVISAQTKITDTSEIIVKNNYSAEDPVKIEENLGELTKYPETTSRTLTINGNGYEIDGNGHSGIIISDSNNTLNLVDVKMKNFESDSNGSVVDNKGNLNISNSTFTNNKGYDGGAIYNRSGSTISDITGTTFSNNNGDNGGAIYNDGGTIGNITGSTFSNNVSNDYSGGAICNRQYATIYNITDSTFSNNKAIDYGGEGGAIRNSFQSTINNITNVTFEKNSAQAFGGAIANGGDIGNITGSFISNYAHKSGGAIYNTGTITSITSDFIGNHGRKYGGAIYNYRGTINVVASRDLLFDGNHAWFGGAIYNEVNSILGLYAQAGKSITFTGNKPEGVTDDNVDGIYNISTLNINGNGTDIYSGTINLQEIEEKSYDLSGTTNIYGGEVNVAKVIRQNELNIYDGKLTINAGNLIVNTIQNEGSILLGEGTLTSAIAGEGLIAINKDVNVTSNANLLGNYILNAGTLTLTEGTLAKGISGGSTVIDGDVIFNTGVLQSSLNINENKTLTANADDLYIIDTFTNNGTLITYGNLNNLTELDNTNGTVKIAENKTLNVTGTKNLGGTLDLNGQTLNMQNNGSSIDYSTLTVGTLKSTGNLLIDATLNETAPDNDKIAYTNGVGAVVNLTNINVKEGFATHTTDIKDNYLTLLDGNSATLKVNGATDGSTSTQFGNYLYTFEKGTDTDEVKLKVTESYTGANLKDSITGTELGKKIDTYSFAGEEKLTEAITTGSVSAEKNPYTVGMNGYNLTAGDEEAHSGITISSGKTLTVDGNGGTITNFAMALSNKGTLVLNNVNFENNSSGSNGGAINNIGTIGDTVGDFVSNSAVSTTGEAFGGAILNNTYATIGNIDGNITQNYAQGFENAEGGAILNYFATIGNITGDITGNYAKGNYVEGGAIKSYNLAKIGNITGNIANNYTATTTGNAQGGAISNNWDATIGDITGDIIGNYTRGYLYAEGGAVNNYKNATIGNITGNIANNYTQSTTKGAFGGAISNYESAIIGDITGDIIGNYTRGYLYAEGGAVNNYKNAKIGNITGNIANNYTQSTTKGAFGGAISNYESAIIGDITGDIIGNYAKGELYADGGAINNYANATIGNITGNIANNYAQSTTKGASGGAIFNNESAKIGNITGNITGNYAKGYLYTEGGAISNNANATIGNITGNITGNYAQSTTKGASGGAIFNNESAKIGNITGNITGNYAKGYLYTEGGAISNNANATIGNIIGDFISNYTISETTSATGGAVANLGTIENITGNFIDNYAVSDSGSANGGAIYNSSAISIVAKNGNEIRFQGNYVKGKDEESSLGGAIYNTAAGTIGLYALTKNDKITFAGDSESGKYDVDGIYNQATLNINGFEKSGETTRYLGEVTLYNVNGDGITNIYGGTVNVAGGFIQKDLNLNAGTFSLGKGGTVTNLNANGGALSMSIADATYVNTINTLTVQELTGDITSFVVDYDPTAAAGSNMDKITIGTGNETGSIKLTSVNVINDDDTVIMADGTFLETANPMTTTDNTGTATSTTTSKGWKYTFTHVPNSIGVVSVTREVGKTLADEIQDPNGSITFSVNTNPYNTDKDLGSLAGIDRNFTIIGNGDRNAIDGTNPAGGNFNGVTVGEEAGQVLNVENITMQNFTTAITNKEGATTNLNNITLTNNTTDIDNAGKLNLAGTNTIDTIIGTGTTTITEGSDTTINSKLEQTNLINNELLTINARNLDIENGVTNNNTLVLKGAGTLKTDITGGTVNIADDIVNTVINEAKINVKQIDIYNDGTPQELVNNGTIIANSMTNAGTLTNNANIQTLLGIDNSHGTLNMNEDSLIQSDIRGGTINSYGGNVIGSIQNGAIDTTLNLNDGVLDVLGGINVASTVAKGGGLNYINDFNTPASLGALDLQQNMDLYLAADLVQGKMNQIKADSVSGAGKINMMLNMPSRIDTILTNPNITLNPIADGSDDALKAAITHNSQTIDSPIFNYQTNYDPTTGLISLATASGGAGSYGDFTPTVFAGAVAAQVGGFYNQLTSYDNAFEHMDSYMNLTRSQRTAMKMLNRYASADANLATYNPNQLAEESKAIWLKPYATFEKVDLKGGPNVENTAYGSFVGGDSDLIELKNGWDVMYSTYVSYDGSHQNYDGVSVYQNGGHLGGTATWYKGNFFTGLTANAGASVAESSTMYGKDDITMLMAGIASKTGYNWELLNSKLIVQPSMLLSYSFVNMFNYTNSAGVAIESDPLHAIQIAPGLKFIGNLPYGWQPYLGVQMVWNIMDETKFSAANVNLPQFSTRPYFQYGLGVQKKWGDRFSGYLQAMLRNGGRTGIALSAGFRWALGKDVKNPDSIKTSNSIPELPKTKIELSSASK